MFGDLQIKGEAMRWIVQSNLGEKEAKKIEEACSSLKLEYVPLIHIPFSNELPDIPETSEPTVFYGATTFIDLIYRHTLDGTWAPAVFFNPYNVCPTWLHAYKHHALNYEAELNTIQNLIDGKYDPGWRVYGDDIFIRPYDDQKVFAGTVIELNKLKEWANSLMTDAPDLLYFPVIAGPAYRLRKEWRLFMHGEDYISGSQYRTDQRLNEHPYVPREVIEFGQQMAKVYNPVGCAPYSLDIGETGDTLYVIEVGCFNSSGFYASDVKEIVRTISERN
jgi:hypothetical protein